MTSPRWPVSVSVPAPCMRDASMNSTSPPTGVHAMPIATPGFFVRSSISSSRKRGAPSSSTTVSRVSVDGLLLPFGPAPRDLPDERRDLALEIADTRLARVAANDEPDRLVGKCHHLRRQPVIGDLLGDEVLLRDLELLLFRIARQLEHFHSVAQRRRNRVEHVRRRHEQHFGQDRTARRGSDRGTSCSAPDRAPRAAPSSDRRGNRTPSLSISSRMNTGFFDSARRRP